MTRYEPSGVFILSPRSVENCLEVAMSFVFALGQKKRKKERKSLRSIRHEGLTISHNSGSGTRQRQLQALARRAGIASRLRKSERRLFAPRRGEVRAAQTHWAASRVQTRSFCSSLLPLDPDQIWPALHGRDNKSVKMWILTLLALLSQFVFW